MNEVFWCVLLTQVVYVAIALLTAVILWKALPEVNKAFVKIGPLRASGAFAGFVFVLGFLHNQWPIAEAKRSLQPIQAGVILTPSKKGDYDNLFDGFENCDFYAFNPPFKLEGESGEHLFEVALETHEKRYLEGGVKSRYLFFDKDSYGRARTFFQKLESKIGKEKLKESVKIANWKNSSDPPGYTFFIGHKEKKPYCIFYPSATMRSGLPETVIYVEGSESFLAILKGHFQEKWEQAIKSGD